MTLEDFFLQKHMDYPIKYSGDFLSELKSKLETYVNSVPHINDPAFNGLDSHLHTDCRNLSSSLTKAVETYLKGTPSVAYLIFSKGMKIVEKAIMSDVFKTQIMPTANGLYRIRPFKTIEDVSCVDLFYVPFEKRHKIGSHRFSIPGYPCLYVGSSALISWYEIDKPSLGKCVVVRYEMWNADQKPLLYLAFHPERTPQALRFFLNNHDLWRQDPTIPSQVLNSILLLYPLILACHFVVQFRNDPFSPEYIVPQMLLQWVRCKSDIAGLCYLSSRVDFDSVPPPLSINYVFPVPSSHAEMEKFNAYWSSTRPFLMSKTNVCLQLSKFNPDKSYFGLNGQNITDPYSDLTIVTGKKRKSYQNTIWGHTELLLQNSRHVRMSEPESSTKFGPSFDLERRRQYYTL